MIKTVADILQVDFSRIQFTPDLMPADVVGSELVEESDGGRQLKFVKGPIFTNILLADEINRTPPKTQSALLEAMEERQVTAAGVTHPMSKPFCACDPESRELEGTYPLPEAQLDRFMFKIELGYLSEDEEVTVVSQTTQHHDRALSHPLSGEDILIFSLLPVRCLLLKQSLSTRSVWYTHRGHKANLRRSLSRTGSVGGQVFELLRT